MRNREKRSKKKNSNDLPQQGTSLIKDISSDLLNQNIHLEIHGNKEAIVEGCSGILEYNEYSIKLSSSKHTLCFNGTNLLIQCMTANGAVITGDIYSVHFSN